MEDTLRVIQNSVLLHSICLNPCFNGRYSQSQIGSRGYSAQIGVLILVLMEDTLRVIKGSELGAYKTVLILVLMEDTLRELS